MSMCVSYSVALCLSPSPLWLGLIILMAVIIVLHCLMSFKCQCCWRQAKMVADTGGGGGVFGQNCQFCAPVICLIHWHSHLRVIWHFGLIIGACRIKSCPCRRCRYLRLVCFLSLSLSLSISLSLPLSLSVLTKRCHHSFHSSFHLAPSPIASTIWDADKTHHHWHFCAMLLHRTVKASSKTVKCQVCFIILEHSLCACLNHNVFLWIVCLSLPCLPFYRLYPPNYSPFVNVSSFLTWKVLSPVSLINLMSPIVFVPFPILFLFGSVLFFFCFYGNFHWRLLLLQPPPPVTPPPSQPPPCTTFVECTILFYCCLLHSTNKTVWWEIFN